LKTAPPSRRYFFAQLGEETTDFSRVESQFQPNKESATKAKTETPTRLEPVVSEK